MQFKVSEIRDAMNASGNLARKEILLDILARHRGDPEGLVTTPLADWEELAIRKGLEELGSQNETPTSQ